MKKAILIILIIFISNLCWGQTFVRQNGECKDSLITKAIGENTIITGNTYELNDSALSIIIYFEIKLQDSSKNIRKPVEFEHDYWGNPFQGRPTMTLFNILFSTDQINYIKYVVDTVDVNSGCCPCHFPVTIDSIILVNSKSNDELILLLTHPVRFDCNSITSYSALFYDNFASDIRAGKFSIRPFSTSFRSYNYFYGDSYLEMIKDFNKKKQNK